MIYWVFKNRASWLRSKEHPTISRNKGNATSRKENFTVGCLQQSLSQIKQHARAAQERIEIERPTTTLCSEKVRAIKFLSPHATVSNEKKNLSHFYEIPEHFQNPCTECQTRVRRICPHLAFVIGVGLVRASWVTLKMIKGELDSLHVKTTLD